MSFNPSDLAPAGKNAVKTGRVMLGATNPLESAPGTIRSECTDRRL